MSKRMLSETQGYDLHRRYGILVQGPKIVEHIGAPMNAENGKWDV
jgi:hypothetical protein